MDRLENSKNFVYNKFSSSALQVLKSKILHTIASNGYFAAELGDSHRLVDMHCLTYA